MAHNDFVRSGVRTECSNAPLATQWQRVGTCGRGGWLLHDIQAPQCPRYLTQISLKVAMDPTGNYRGRWPRGPGRVSDVWLETLGCGFRTEKDVHLWVAAPGGVGATDQPWPFFAVAFSYLAGWSSKRHLSSHREDEGHRRQQWDLKLTACLQVAQATQGLAGGRAGAATCGICLEFVNLWTSYFMKEKYFSFI